MLSQLVLDLHVERDRQKVLKLVVNLQNVQRLVLPWAMMIWIWIR